MASTCTAMSTAPTNCGRERAFSQMQQARQATDQHTSECNRSCELMRALGPRQAGRRTLSQSVWPNHSGSCSVLTQGPASRPLHTFGATRSTACQLQPELGPRPTHHASTDWVVRQGGVEAEQPQPEDEQAYRQHHVPKAASDRRSFSKAWISKQAATVCWDSEDAQADTQTRAGLGISKQGKQDSVEAHNQTRSPVGSLSALQLAA